MATDGGKAGRASFDFPWSIKPLLVSMCCAGVLLVVQGCATENVTEVIVGSVSIRPSSATAVEGGIVEFDATVIDESGASLDGAPVRWSSDAPDVALVDELGVARALSDGVANIEAAFRGAVGSATITVLPASSIELAPATVSLIAGAGGEAPTAEDVGVANGGSGTLTDLSANVRYPDGGSAGWLSVDLSPSMTPATLTLTTDIDELPAGRYDATVLVSTGDQNVAPAPLEVSLSLTGFTMAETEGGTEVDEDGGMDTLMVALDVEPATDVVLTLESSDPGEADVSPPSLTFTPADWSTPRAVVVSAVDDDVADGDQTSEIRVAVEPDGSDPAWAPTVTRTFDVTTRDDDRAGFTVSERSGGTSMEEGRSTDEVSVALDSEPGSSVVLRLESADADQVVVSPESMMFTSVNWRDPQSVTVTAVDNVVVDGDRTVPLTVSVEADGNSTYGEVEDQLVGIGVRDDETAGLVLTETGQGTSVAEGGASDTIMVALTGQPLSDVVVTIESDDEADAAVEPARLTFPPARWDEPRPAVISAVDDNAVDGDRARAFTIAVEPAGSAEAFRGISETMAVHTLDDDVAGFAVTESRGSTVAREGGASDTVMVVLTARPLTEVTIAVSSDDESDATVSPTRVAFGPADWNVPRPVTFAAVEDGMTDGLRFRTLTLSVDPIVSDAAFHGLTRTVSGVTLDRNVFRAPGG